MLGRLAKSVKVLVREKNALGVRERRALADLRRFLPRLGYQVVGVADGKPARRTRALRKSLKCPRCGRRFALAMHLGRHVGAMHRTGRRGKRAAKKARSKRR